MLSQEIAKKINEFVYTKPRTVQEVALLLKVNWRTADSYVSKIAEEQGTINCRTFREGTRGALKIVFWNNTEKLAASEVQEKILRKIETGRRKEDFSPLDIFQFDDKKKRQAFIDIVDPEETKRDRDLIPLLKKAEKEVYIFSGNTSFLSLKHGNEKVLDVIEETAKRANIKILSRVDIIGAENIKKLLALNQRIGRNAIEVRYAEQPLRGIIVDNKIARLREIKSPQDYRPGELKGKTYVYYEIYDEDWILWLQKIFWSMFRPAIDAKTRIEIVESFKA
jgi:hypothetical protein